MEPVLITPADLAPPSQAVQLLARLARAPWLALPPVALPDLHCKPHLESPSSLVTATADVLVLGLTSPSPHCGMGLALTDLEVDFATPERLDRLFGCLGARLDPRRSTPVLDEAALDAVLLGGLPRYQEWEGSVAVMPTMAGEGAAFAPAEATLDRDAILATVPGWLRSTACREFGLVGGGNHFLELQVVSGVANRTLASAWGIHPGQLVLMAHADSGHLGAVLGRMFAHRRKNTRRGRWQEWRAKLPYQLAGVRSARALLERAQLFWPGRWVPIPAASETGLRCRRAMGAAANYAAAGRLAVWGEVADALAEVGTSGRLRLLWDAPHNGIWRECVDGRTLWVHRHNATRATPGRPVLLPGCGRSASLLCAGGGGVFATLNSAPHGAGWASQQLGHVLGAEEQHGGTRLYLYREPVPRRVPYLSDDGLRVVASTLAHRGIAHPVAYLRPLATLKGSWT